MKANKKIQWFRAGIVLAACLFLGNPLQAGAVAQSGGGGGVAENIAAGELSGKVVETMNSGGYTYVLLDKGGAKTWVALPMTKIAAGSEIACQPGMVMQNFTSTTLNRTFASIVFSAGLASAGGAVLTAQGPVAALAPVAPVKVAKAQGVDAQTIGEIYTNKNALANKPVTVQGKVVKVSSGIMGKNWLHLQDGSGSQAAGTHDLVVTTDSVPKVGEVVIVKGNLSLDRDFGAGYRYGVIIEGAEISSSK